VTPRQRKEVERYEADARDGVGWIGCCLLAAAWLMVFL